MDRPPEPVGALSTAGLFSKLGSDLLGLLDSLSPEQWNAPTICSDWQVRDIAAHLLDTACRRLSMERDGYAPPQVQIAGYSDLVGHLNDLNAQWVVASRRLSPKVIQELLGFVEPQLSRHLESLDPWSRAMFPVAWAGEEESLCWFDVARELTERWHHQQQIRLAVGALPLSDPETVAPVMETFLHALPYRYQQAEIRATGPVNVQIAGVATYRFSLRANGGEWALYSGSHPEPRVDVTLEEETAWRLFTRGLEGGAARERAKIEGDDGLADPIFATLAVMA